MRLYRTEKSYHSCSIIRIIFDSSLINLPPILFPPPLQPHPLVIDLFQGAKDPDLPFDSNILPMVSPPLPWTSARFGGYPLSASKYCDKSNFAIQNAMTMIHKKFVKLSISVIPDISAT